MIRTDGSVAANDAAMPARERPRGAGRQAAARQARRPSARVAPAMTGSAAWRDRTLASARAKPRARAAVSVAPLRETPGISAQACASPSAQRVDGARVLARGARRGRARRRPPSPARPATSPAAIVAGVPSRRSIARSSASPASAGGSELSATSCSAAAVEPRAASRDLVAQADEQRRGGAGVQRDLEGLAQLAVERA